MIRIGTVCLCIPCYENQLKLAFNACAAAERTAQDVYYTRLIDRSAVDATPDTLRPFAYLRTN